MASLRSVVMLLRDVPKTLSFFQSALQLPVISSAPHQAMLQAGTSTRCPRRTPSSSPALCKNQTHPCGNTPTAPQALLKAAKLKPIFSLNLNTNPTANGARVCWARGSFPV